MSDYGGKTRQQEAVASMAVIVGALLAVGLAIIGCLLAWWLL